MFFEKSSVYERRKAGKIMDCIGRFLTESHMSVPNVACRNLSERAEMLRKVLI